MTLTIASSFKSNCDVYRLRFVEGGWAHFYLCEETGGFLIQSDWGDYSYMWAQPGRGTRTLKEFIATSNEHYIVDKLGYAKPYEWRLHLNEKKTKQALKDVLKESDGDVSDLLKEVDELEFEETNFAETAAHLLVDSMSRELLDALSEHPYMFLKYDVGVWFYIIRDRVFPAFRNYLRAELGITEPVS